MLLGRLWLTLLSYKLTFLFRIFDPCLSFFRIVWRRMHRLPAPRCLSLTRWISYQMTMQEESWIGFQSSYQTTFTLSCRHFLERSTSVYLNCRYETLLNVFSEALMGSVWDFSSLFCFRCFEWTSRTLRFLVDDIERWRDWFHVLFQGCKDTDNERRSHFGLQWRSCNCLLINFAVQGVIDWWN